MNGTGKGLLTLLIFFLTRRQSHSTVQYSSLWRTDYLPVDRECEGNDRGWNFPGVQDGVQTSRTIEKNLPRMTNKKAFSDPEDEGQYTGMQSSPEKN